MGSTELPQGCRGNCRLYGYYPCVAQSRFAIRSRSSLCWHRSAFLPFATVNCLPFPLAPLCIPTHILHLPQLCAASVEEIVAAAPLVASRCLAININLGWASERARRGRFAVSMPYTPHTHSHTSRPTAIVLIL